VHFAQLKKYRHHFYVEYFQISGIFPTSFGCFLPENTTNKCCWIIEILLYHFFAIFKVSRPAAFETKTRPETFETENRKSGSRDRDQVSRLHHWWLFIYAVWFYSNHTLHPTTLRWKTTTNLAFIDLKVELYWYLKLFYYWSISMCFDCTFLSFLSFCHEINSGAIYSIIMSLMIPD